MTDEEPNVCGTPAESEGFGDADWFAYFILSCTERERDMAGLMMDGQTNIAEIARRLGISRSRAHSLKSQVERRIRAAKRIVERERRNL